MSDATPGGLAAAPLNRARRAIVVVDVVESVRLMQRHEDAVIDRWRRFVNEVVTEVLPPHGGRLVKSLGDGMLLEFERVPQAVAAALDIQGRVPAMAAGMPTDAALQLRAGVHLANVVIDEHDIYGSGVNIAARLSTLARPGEVVVSVDVRDEMVPGLDADVVDLGECFLKHIDQPVRAFRLSPSHARRALDDGAAQSVVPTLGATLAVLSFRPRAIETALHESVGDLLADEVSASLAASPFLQVISRLSTMVLTKRDVDTGAIGAALGANYLISGHFDIAGDRVRVVTELAHASSGAVLWAAALQGSLRGIVEGIDDIVPAIVAAVSEAVLQRELQRIAAAPLPNLESYCLLLTGITLLHRCSAQEFSRAQHVLDALAERHSRLPQARAWLSLWHAMRVVQGLSPDVDRDRRQALDQAERALDANPMNVLALTMKGLISGFLFRDLAAAEHHYAQALALDPNNTLAWLYTSSLRSWQGRGVEALDAARRALRLSPLDPLRYYYETHVAFAAMVAGEHRVAVEHGTRSLQANRLHTATHRTLAISQWQLGQAEAARETVAEMLRLEPGFTADAYLRRFPGGDNERSRTYADILVQAGAPR